MPSELKGGKTGKRFIFIYLKFLFFRPLIVEVGGVIEKEETSGETSDSQKSLIIFEFLFCSALTSPFSKFVEMWA